MGGAAFLRSWPLALPVARGFRIQGLTANRELLGDLGAGCGEPVCIATTGNGPGLTPAELQSNLASALDQMWVMPQWGHFTEVPVSTDR